MKLTRTQKVRLGVFVVVGVALLAGSIAVLAGMRVWERRDHYTTRFSGSVSGLEVSATVRYSGLRVGTVDRMRIAPDDSSSIEVHLALEPDVVLHEGTRAVLDSSGLTGLKTIDLRGGDPRAPVIPPGSQLPSDAGAMGRMVDSAASVAEKINQVATTLAIWTNDENRRRVERILVSLDGFLRSADELMRTSKDPLTRALENMDDATLAVTELSREGSATLREVRTELTATLAAVRKPVEKLNPADIAETVTSMKQLLARFDQRLSQEEAGKALENFSQTLVQMNRLMQELDLAVRAGREDFTASLGHVRQATEDLREFSRLIAQDPSILVRGREVR